MVTISEVIYLPSSDITEILLKVALNTITPYCIINQLKNVSI
jgi:hypothetical protein